MWFAWIQEWVEHRKKSRMSGSERRWRCKEEEGSSPGREEKRKGRWKWEGVASWRSGLKNPGVVNTGKGHGGLEEDEALADILNEKGFSADHSLSSGSSGNRVTGLEIKVWSLKGIYPFCSQTFNGFLLWERLWLFSFPLFPFLQATNRTWCNNKRVEIYFLKEFSANKSGQLLGFVSLSFPQPREVLSLLQNDKVFLSTKWF